MMNTKPELIDGAVRYLRIYVFGMPALALFNFGNAVLSASGDTKRPLYYLSFAGVINVILNLFFVIIFFLLCACELIEKVCHKNYNADYNEDTEHTEKHNGK